MAKVRETDSEREAREAQEALDAEDMGTGAKARDGEPNGGEDGEPVSLEERRARRGRAVDANGGEGDELRPGDGEEDDGQLFVWEQGRKVTLGSLIARGISVEHAFVFGGKRLKGRGQMMGFEEDSLIVGRGKVDKTVIVPTRDGDEKVTKVTIETHLAMKVIVPAESDEAWGMLAPIIDKRQSA